MTVLGLDLGTKTLGVAISRTGIIANPYKLLKYNNEEYDKLAIEMADIIKKATRESYGESLRDLAEKYENLVVLDADLAAATKTGIFKKEYPNRHFNCGIAESNMICAAYNRSKGL